MSKKFIAIISLLIIVIGTGITTYLVLSSRSTDIRDKAATGEDLLVCPLGDTDTECNFYGGDGIQTAVNQISDDNLDGWTIYIKEGTYTRTNPSIFSYETSDGRTVYIKAFLDLKNKSFTIEGLGNVILDGQKDNPDSFNLIGIAKKGNNLATLINISISNMGIDPNTCDYYNPSGCSFGSGIYIRDNAHIDLLNLKIYNNDYSGVRIYGGVAIIKASQIYNNQYGLISDTTSSISYIYNNLFYDNGSEAISIVNSSITHINNNLIYNNANTDSSRPGGISIYGNSNVFIKNNIIYKNNKEGIYRVTSGEFQHTGTYTLLYNIVFDNEIANYYGLEKGEYDLEQDPFLKSTQEPYDFHLKSNSPAINAGDTDLFDPDGSRSDIGAYGGPDACLLDPNLIVCMGAKECNVAEDCSANSCIDNKRIPVICDDGICVSQTEAICDLTCGAKCINNSDCDSNQLCNLEICTCTTSCSGCIDSEGNCQEGNKDDQCGINGVNCASCLPGKCLSDGVCFYSGDRCDNTDIWGKEQKNDGIINIYDLSLVISNWSKTGSPGWITSDVHGKQQVPDGKIDIYDISKIISCWTKI